MNKHWKIIINWSCRGLLLGLIVALLGGPSPQGDTSIFIYVGLYLGLIISLLHSLAVLAFDKQRQLQHLIPIGTIISVLSILLITYKISESKCEISEASSYQKAIEYSKENGYPPEYLSKSGYKLDGCKYGFEYNSTKHFRLFIVDSNGRVQLND